MQIEKCNDVKMLIKMRDAGASQLKRATDGREIISNRMLAEINNELQRVEQRIAELTKEKL